MRTHTARRPLLRRAALASYAVTASCAVLAACTAAPHGPDTDVTAPAVGRPPAPASAQAALLSEAFTPYAGLGAVDNDGLAPGDTYDALHTACMNDAGYGQYASQAPYAIRTNSGFTFAQPYGWQGYIGTALAAQQGFLAGTPFAPGASAAQGPGQPGAPFTGMPAGAQAAAGKCLNILENFNNAQFAHSMAIIETLNNDIGNAEVADGSIKRAMANWSACMAKNGYRTSNANTFSQQALENLGLRPPPGKNPAPAGPPGPPTAAQNQAQIAMAVADANCTLTSDLAGIYFAVQANYEQQFVSANQQALNAGVREYKAAFAKTLKSLPTLLQTTSAVPNLPGPARPHGSPRPKATPSPSRS
jgi:hypothetical protein